MVEKQKKIRLDTLIHSKGFTESREQAKKLIMAGLVYVDNQKADKAGETYAENCKLEVRGSQKYVSRGGYKLEKAIEVFNIDLTDVIAMDIGASTGGFTHCMLQNGAKKVFSVDVGYGQLAWSLRTDSRVVNMERTNIRYLSQDEIGTQLDFLSIDVSFISLKLVLPVACGFLKEGGKAVALIKPQFEAGRDKVGKKGVVRDITVHKEVVSEITSFAIENGFSVLDLDFSPIKGPEGNIEYLIYLEKSNSPEIMSAKDFNEVVEQSHIALK